MRISDWSSDVCSSDLVGAGVVGFFGYGVSLVLFVLALRYLGTARTGAYFSMAPFIGAVLALTMFSEPVTTRLIIAAVLMGIGLWLHLVERHDHDHVHESLDHAHAHRSEERRVGKEWVSTGRSRWLPYH